eukprot:Gb_00834 [translate_table: standard]
MTQFFSARHMIDSTRLWSIFGLSLILLVLLNNNDNLCSLCLPSLVLYLECCHLWVKLAQEKSNFNNVHCRVLKLMYYACPLRLLRLCLCQVNEYDFSALAREASPPIALDVSLDELEQMNSKPFKATEIEGNFGDPKHFVRNVPIAQSIEKLHDTSRVINFSIEIRRQRMDECPHA